VKKGLENEAATQKTKHLFFEHREQTIHDRREPTIYCLSATIGNASRRYCCTWPDEVSRPLVTLPEV